MRRSRPTETYNRLWAMTATGQTATRTERLKCAESGYSLVRGPTGEIPILCSTWGKPHSRPTYSVWAEAGFPAFTLYACKSMLRFSFTRSSITSERTSLLFFFGKVLRYSMIACHSLTSIEELAPAPRTA